MNFNDWLNDKATGIDFGTSFFHLSPITQALTLLKLRQENQSPLLCVTSTQEEAEALKESCDCFLSEKESIVFSAYTLDEAKGLLPEVRDLAKRSRVLYEAQATQPLIFASLESLLQKVPPKETFLKGLLTLSQENPYDREELISRLLLLGYQRQPITSDVGTFSVRGGVIDFFSPLYDSPVRVDYFDNTIETLKFFDPQSQRSHSDTSDALILPVHMGILAHLNSSEKNVITTRYRRYLEQVGYPLNERDELVRQLMSGVWNHEKQLLFPLLYSESQTLLDYLPPSTRYVWLNKSSLVEQSQEEILPYYQEQLERFAKNQFPTAPLKDLIEADFKKRSVDFSREYLFESFESDATSEGFRFKETHFFFQKTRGSKPDLDDVIKKIRAWIEQSFQINLICQSKTHLQKILSLLESFDIPVYFKENQTCTIEDIFHITHPGKVCLWKGHLDKGIVLEDLSQVILSESDIFGQRKKTTRSASPVSAQKQMRLLRQLKENDYVVHKTHGIGKYLGLTSKTFGEIKNDYVVIEYQGGDKLYLPVYHLSAVQKYVGAERGKVATDKLGGDRWKKAKKKASHAAHDLAAQLVKIQAQRKLKQAKAYQAPLQDYQKFELSFPYDETEDQLKAIEEILHDIQLESPMDRLLVGDVGYGKTEVAMRAAFQVAASEGQVAIVVPTTVLALQHYESFKDRFKDTAINVDMVSRLRKKSEIDETLKKLTQGQVDILIGTHRIFSADVRFKELGLVIVDEEHRFGVSHKEKLKKMGDSVHYLSMTATPIPRTLNMAMVGIRDISLITTPPPDRLTVKTYVSKRAPETIKESIENELNRGGQVFFLHNRVETLGGVVDEIQSVLPHAKFEVAHGQMTPDQLEKKMLRFYQGEVDILVSTAIIESGVDVSRANTILIDRADTLGLAQLYQLRGRVGRSQQRAYCYLLVPPQRTLNQDAQERLKVLQRYSELGAGFQVANYDLEMRGSGNILGKQQSGHVHAVGIDMYFDLLEQSLSLLKGKSINEVVDPEIRLPVGAFFPEDYLPDMAERVRIYQRLSATESEEEVDQIEREINDRFGAAPDEVDHLIGLMRIRYWLKQLGVTHLNCGPKKVSLMFTETNPVVEPQKLINLIQAQPNDYSLSPGPKLVFETSDNKKWYQIYTEIKKLCGLMLKNL